MDANEKYDLITKDLKEVIGQDELREILSKRDIHIYWGTAPTGKPHVGYFVPMLKIADFLEAGCRVTILFADMHAYLDSMKSSFEQLEKRTQYYEWLIKEMLTLAGVPLDKLSFVKGTDIQLSKEYTLDMYKLSALASSNDAKRAGSQVVKQAENPKVSSLLYPILQALDEEYLKVDAQFGGIDQRKIMMHAREFLPKIGYKKRIELMNPLIPGLTQSGKMSSSEPHSKIDFEDSEKATSKKIHKAYSVDGVVEGNGLLAIAQFILCKQLAKSNSPFVITRPAEYGGDISFKNYTQLEEAFATQKLSSIDLKQGVATHLNAFLKPLRDKLPQIEHIKKDAYD